MMTTACRCYMTKCICCRVWAVRSTFRISLFRNTLRKPLLRSSLFWNFTRLRLVFSYRRFGTTYWPHLQGLALEGGADRLFRNGDNCQSRLRNLPKKRKISFPLRLKPEVTHHLSFPCLRNPNAFYHLYTGTGTARFERILCLLGYTSRWGSDVIDCNFCWSVVYVLASISSLPATQTSQELTKRR